MESYVAKELAAIESRIAVRDGLIKELSARATQAIKDAAPEEFALWEAVQALADANTDDRATIMGVLREEGQA